MIRIRRLFTWERWQLFYVALSLSWLLGPSVNQHLSTKITFISQYEDAGQPWSWLFRLCDTIAALLLGLAVWVIIRSKRADDSLPSLYGPSVVLLSIIAIGSLVDVSFPSVCHGSGLSCVLPNHISRMLHAGESVITSLALLILSCLWGLKRTPWSRPVLFVQLLWIVTFVFGQLATPQTGNTLVQFGYEIIVTLWIAMIVPSLAGQRGSTTPSKRQHLVVRVITAWIFLGGFIAVLSAILNIEDISRLSSVYFGNNTAWLSQHGVAVGIVLMYISRHLWRGEYRAWQLASVLLWLETLKYSLVSPNSTLVLLYGLTAAMLFMQRKAFDRLTSTEELQDRLRKLGIVLAAVLLALLAGITAFRFKHHQDIDNLHINITHFVQHLFLFDVVNDLGPLPRRLLGQVLNVAGLTLLLAVIVSLFRPQKPLLRPANQHDRQRLLALLSIASNSSEDYFKYWPQPKNYWWSADQKAVVAYQVMGNVAFALADPIASQSNVRQQAMEEFLGYCRSHGWRACFLMVQTDGQKLYKAAGYKLFRIGASAMVNLEKFNSETARNKWWRWVLNKAKKNDWHYELSTPPHSHKLLSQARQLSDAWLQRQNHTERGFALGYFDASYLQACRLHLLWQSSSLVAFANELPTFNNQSAATIDLMRFSPRTSHAMPALLAHIIKQLHDEQTKHTFDLGFVPLASPTARTEQVVTLLGQLLMSEAISAQGLEQFKNKFSPEWANNYIAFDGDWIDLIHISRQLDKLLAV